MATPPSEPPKSAPARQNWRENAIALGVFTLVFAWLQRGWLAQARDSVPMTAPGGFADAQLIVWVLDWVSQRLRSDFGRILDAPINYPELGQLTGSEHFASSQLFFFPLETAVGNPILAANLAAMLCYPATAFAMYVFLRSLGARALPAFFGGFSLALGPFQIPGNLHILQLLSMFFPLTAWALHRLRDNPGARATLLCGFVYLVGLMSSFYIAFLLSAFFVVWAVVELTRAKEAPGMYACAASVAWAIPIAIFLALSLPYLSRPEVHPDRGLLWVMEATTSALAGLLRIFGEERFTLGVASTAAASLGVLAFARHEFKAYAVGCTVLAIGGVFLYIGGLQLIASFELPGILGTIATFGGQFFRIFPRGLALTAFAFATFATLGLETVWRRSPLVGALAVTFATILLMAIRGPVLATPYIHKVSAFSEHTQAYEDLRHIASTGASGCLLELPRRGNPKIADAEAMMGQLIHGIPLVTGHTGYLPAGRKQIDRILAHPLNPQTLDELLRSTTRLRWIVLRPRQTWLKPGLYSLALRTLRSSSDLVAEHHLGTLRVFEMRGETAERGALAPGPEFLQHLALAR